MLSTAWQLPAVPIRVKSIVPSISAAGSRMVSLRKEDQRWGRRNLMPIEQ